MSNFYPDPVRRRRRKKRGQGLGLILAFAGGLYISQQTTLLDDVSSWYQSSPIEGWVAENFEPAETIRTPLGAPPVPDSTGARAFMHLKDDGSPVAYDPCHEVRYVIRPAGEVPGGEELIHKAIEEISAATGLQFVYEGFTTEAPSDNRESIQEKYGSDWAPILISWSDPIESPILEGPTIGLGGSQALGTSNADMRYVTGALTLDGPQLLEVYERSPSGEDEVYAVILHELGHLVGLDHVDDPAELMYPETIPGMHHFAGGDLQGLAELGAGECYPDLPS